MRSFAYWTPIFLIALCQFSPTFAGEVRSCLAVVAPLEAAFKALNYYARLGVPRNASKEDIKKAYRKLAMQYHPDRSTGGVEAIFKLAKEAYETLEDAEKKLAYDKYTDFSEEAKTTADTTPRSGKPRTEREKFIDEFNSDLANMSETNRFIAGPILGMYGIARRDHGPVQGFIKIMRDWYPPANRFERNDANEIGSFLLKHFYFDFKVNSPTTSERYELWKILKGRHTENQEIQNELIQAIATQSKNISEAIEYSLYANTAYSGSGIRIRELINLFPKHYQITGPETAWLIVFYTVRMKTDYKYIDQFYKDTFQELMMIGSKESLEMLMKLRASYKWSQELLRDLEGHVYNIGVNRPEALQALVQSRSTYAADATNIFNDGKRRSKALEEAFRGFDPSRNWK